MIVLRTVGRQPPYLALGFTSFAALVLLNLWSSQVLVIGKQSVSVFVEPLFIIAALLMSLLFGVLVPLEIYAFRTASALAAQTGGTALGALVGVASMTCCAPVLLPSVLSLLGFSGVTILGLNATLNRFWVPLATLSIILLIYSLVATIRSLEAPCRLGSRPASLHSTHQ
jgi:hypothetical protein